MSLNRPSITVMSLTAGIAVANTYYAQPILKEIAVSCAITESQAAIIPILSISGYGAGLFFLTPLGDKFNRKVLIIITQLLLVTVLAGMASTNDYRCIYILSFFLGFFSIIAQLIIPMAAALNKNVAGVVTGLLTGILAARVVSGYITTQFGWHYVYGLSAILVTATTICFYYFLPNVSNSFNGNYFLLLGSAITQLKRFSILRRQALLGALIFGTFSSFWTTLTLFLSNRYPAHIIGLFSLIGLSGALATMAIGKYKHIQRLRMPMVATIGASILLLMVFPSSVILLICSIILLDIGVQGTQLISLGTIYKLDPSAHSRINTVYMTTCFIGGAIGTLAGLLCWKAGGWNLVLWQLLIFSLAAFITQKTIHHD